MKYHYALQMIIQVARAPYLHCLPPPENQQTGHGHGSFFSSYRAISENERNFNRKGRSSKSKTRKVLRI